MPLAGMAPFYEAPSEHNQRATARTRSKLASSASSSDTESADAPPLSDTRRWLGAGGRSWFVAPRPHAEEEMPLDGTAPFYEVSYGVNQPAAARARRKPACCAATPPPQRQRAQVRLR